MKKIFAILIFSLFCYKYSHAQSPIELGSESSFHSEILNRDFQLQVYTPTGYADTDRTYPTLYVLDGQWFFFNAVGIQKTLRGDAFLPEMIVVGIMKNRPERDEIFENDWDNYKIFLEEELVAYIDNNYRTNSDRLLFGWENAAFLATEMILMEDSNFSGVIAASGAEIIQEQLEKFDQLGKKRYVYLANTRKDIYTISYSDQAAKVLENYNPKNIIWQYDLLKNDVHESTAYTSMYEGLKFYYHNYPTPVFGSIKEFNELGGMSYVKEYFQERSERFQQSPDIDESTKNMLIWLSWRQDEFEEFDTFMTLFKDVLSTKRYASAYWQNRLGQFYLKNKAYDKAVSFFDTGITKYSSPEYNAQMHRGLSECYFNLGKKRMAINSIKKAIEYAENYNDEQVDEYMEMLNKYTE